MESFLPTQHLENLSYVRIFCYIIIQFRVLQETSSSLRSPREALSFFPPLSKIFGFRKPPGEQESLFTSCNDNKSGQQHLIHLILITDNAVLDVFSPWMIGSVCQQLRTELAAKTQQLTLQLMEQPQCLSHKYTEFKLLIKQTTKFNLVKSLLKIKG